MLPAILRHPTGEGELSLLGIPSGAELLLQERDGPAPGFDTTGRKGHTARLTP